MMNGEDFEVTHDGYLRAKCKVCKGRGWTTSDGKDWADPCSVCGGFGAISRHRIIKATGICRLTLDRYLHARELLRPKTRERVEMLLKKYGFA